MNALFEPILQCVSRYTVTRLVYFYVWPTCMRSGVLIFETQCIGLSPNLHACVDEIRNSVSQMWGWPWQILGAIRAVAIVWSPTGDHLETNRLNVVIIIGLLFMVA